MLLFLLNVKNVSQKYISFHNKTIKKFFLIYTTQLIFNEKNIIKVLNL